MSKKVLYIDTETTGTHAWRNDVIQIAALVEIDDEIVETYMEYCQPFDWETVEPKALEVNNLTMEQLRSFPSPSQVFGNFKSLLKKYVDPFDKTDKFTLAGQNVVFDRDFMAAWFKKNQEKFFYSFFEFHCLDLLPILSFLRYKGDLQLPNLKLGTVCEQYGIEFDAHDALEDIKATRDVMLKIISQIQFGDRPVTIPEKAPTEAKQQEIVVDPLVEPPSLNF